MGLRNIKGLHTNLDFTAKEMCVCETADDCEMIK